MHLGVYLYPAGVAFINANHTDYEGELDMGELPPEGQWWDRSTVLTYRHESDHFQNFILSPYLQHVSHLSEAYVTACNQAIQAVADMGGWSRIYPSMPLLLQRTTHGESKDHGPKRTFNFNIDQAANLKTLLSQMLESPRIYRDFAARLSYVTGMTGARKDLDMSGYYVPAGVATESQLFPEGLSVRDLLEASARLQELRLLSTWDVSDSQIAFWIQSKIFGNYASVLPKLWGLIQTEIIHAALALSFRVAYFPFLRDNLTSEPTLADIHPGNVFISMIELLLSSGKAFAPGERPRSPDTINALLDEAVELLCEKFDIVTSGEPFRRSHRTLWGAFLDPSNASLLEERQLLPLINTLDELARIRDIRLDYEREDRAIKLTFKPTLEPFAFLFRDGEKTSAGFRPLRSSESGFIASPFETLAVQHAFGDLAIFGDTRLAEFVSAIFSVDVTRFMSIAGEPLGIPSGFRDYEVVAQRASNWSAVYESWPGPDRFPNRLSV